MIRRKKDYTFLRMLALITQLGISMLTCIFLLYDDHAFYKVKICVQLAKIFHLHQWEKERRIR